MTKNGSTSRKGPARKRTDSSSGLLIARLFSFTGRQLRHIDPEHRRVGEVSFQQS
ncbi:hypothetical protein EDC39_104181 [Geothermobacter ehrlichii]|uniref:Uncharacterized protein n=1 Tax=Geothermobacter ehrlichii TaxID=213224 RepID=A0A5D3WM03_9BACT|nr:hypothetical protein [Geothermobacter ehrlichii]TYO99057.1 hypothetical protein EDC39_104181 [Geothermobacter ehrlichii]